MSTYIVLKMRPPVKNIIVLFFDIFLIVFIFCS
jgi:hypothetical protein